MVKTDIKKTMSSTNALLTEKGFSKIVSPGLLQPKFGYPFAPSAGHHFIDSIMISEKNPTPIQKFSVLPDRSLRMYDVEKIGISARHLSFFETIVFGYIGASENLPKEESCKELLDLYCSYGLNPSKLLITTFSNAYIEGSTFSSKEDEIFYRSWRELLGETQVKKITGRRNFFYSRKLGNPGGTGCELYYDFDGEFVEIGSQVNYKFVFTGGLERTRNAAILQGFGLERLLMTLENKKKIGEVSTMSPLKEVVRDYLKTLGEDKQTINLYDENLTKIADSSRAITMIIYDAKGQINNLNNSQKKILDTFKKSLYSELTYLGIKPAELIAPLLNCASSIFEERYDLKETQDSTMKYLIQT